MSGWIFATGRADQKTIPDVIPAGATAISVASPGARVPPVDESVSQLLVSLTVQLMALVATLVSV